MNTRQPLAYYKVELKNCDIPFKELIIEDFSELLLIIRIAKPFLMESAGQLIITAVPALDKTLVEDMKLNAF